MIPLGFSKGRDAWSLGESEREQTWEQTILVVGICSGESKSARLDRYGRKSEAGGDGSLVQLVF